MQQFLIVVELLLLNFVNSMRFRLNMQQTCIIACGGPLGIFIIFFFLLRLCDPNERDLCAFGCKDVIELEGMAQTSGLNGLLERL